MRITFAGIKTGGRRKSVEFHSGIELSFMPLSFVWLCFHAFDHLSYGIVTLFRQGWWRC